MKKRNWSGAAAALGCAAVVAIGSGCVPQDKYDGLLTSYRTLQEQNVSLQSEVESKEATARMLQERMAQASGQLQNLEVDNQRLKSEIDRIAGDYDQLLTQLNSMELGPLPDEANIALQRLADQNPGLLTFDARTGMVRFASDLTFDLGSTELTSEAREGLRALAAILSTEALAKYEVRIVGHTDAVPIGQPATRAKHPTNVHLSVHRAISVRDALADANIASQRMMVAGYGPYRPIVQEGPRGAAENRRVEILIVPMRGVNTSLPASTSGTKTATVDTDSPEPMK